MDARGDEMTHLSPLGVVPGRSVRIGERDRVRKVGGCLSRELGWAGHGERRLVLHILDLEGVSERCGALRWELDAEKERRHELIDHFSILAPAK